MTLKELLEGIKELPIVNPDTEVKIELLTGSVNPEHQGVFLETSGLKDVVVIRQ